MVHDLLRVNTHHVRVCVELNKEVNAHEFKNIKKLFVTFWLESGLSSIRKAFLDSKIIQAPPAPLFLVVFLLEEVLTIAGQHCVSVSRRQQFAFPQCLNLKTL